jgi:thiosulfate reductase cytochrome b subunit
MEVLISHPRFYWGEVGNVLTPPLFSLPIPASRSAVPTGYGYVLPDQNGWSRSLHFQAAWALVFTGIVYGLFGFITRHFRRELLPQRSQLTWPLSVIEHADMRSYNVLQRIVYLGVIFGLFPLMIWTGLAMSPAVVSAFPGMVTVFGGHQSARTIHFFASALLVFFVAVHIVMVSRAGFRSRTGAMITGRINARKERP